MYAVKFCAGGDLFVIDVESRNIIGSPYYDDPFAYNICCVQSGITMEFKSYEHILEFIYLEHGEDHNLRDTYLVQLKNYKRQNIFEALKEYAE